MGRITAQIELVDRMTGTLNSITSALTATTSAAQNLTGSMQGLQSAVMSGGASGMQQATAQTAQNMQQTADNTGKATDTQENLNRALNEGVSGSNRLWDAVKGIGAAYLSIQGIQKMVSASDELASTTARLNVMSDSFAAAGKEASSAAEMVRQVYAAAQDARGSFSDMAAVVAKFGNNAGEAFGSTDEVIRFANLVQKQMAIAGASTQEASNAMLQLSQALGSGVLRGDELNSIFEQAPNLIQSIADYMGVSIGQIRELASEGQITADIVKAAMFSAADDIDERFGNMPMTWSQVMQSIANTALMGFQPVLDKINELANNPAITNFASGLINRLGLLASYALALIDVMSEFKAVLVAVAIPVGALTGALLINEAVLAAHNAQLVISNVQMALHGAATAILAAKTALFTTATAIATAAQSGFNAALAACPITWIVAAIVGLIAVIVALIAHFHTTATSAATTFGSICGAINVVIAFFKNLGLAAAGIMMGIWAMVGACAENISIAFSNAISGVQAMFYNLLSTACSVIAGIAEALNKLPFVEFDYSGIASAADDYAAKAAAAANTKSDYVDVISAANAAQNSTGAFQQDWDKVAFAEGAVWGDSVAAKISSKFSTPDTSFLGMNSSDMADSLAQTAANTGDTAGSAASIADSVDISSENLKYLRDIAESEAINQFTTAEIQVAMTNNNNVSSSMDIDGMIDTLSAGVLEAMEMAAEGVH